MNALEIIASIKQGIVPEDLNVKTQYMVELMRFEVCTSSSQALLITIARRNNFGNDREWAAWCEENFDYTSSHRCHLCQAGRLLLDAMDNIELFQKLFAIEQTKLISIERLDRLDIDNFLAANNVADMTRDAVRDAVNKWLGIDVTESKRWDDIKKPEQPDLFGFVDNVCALKSETIIRAVSDHDKAVKFIRAGLGLYGSGMDYLKRNDGMPNESIDKFEAMLNEELMTLRVIRAKAAGLTLKD